MVFGILAGVLWALETVILGVALSMTPFISDAQGIVLAPFVSAFIHDATSAVYMWIYNVIKGKSGEVFKLIKTKNFGFLLLSSAIGGPIGMTGYVMAVDNMGASIGAVASAVYPAIGGFLAYLFLKEKLKPYQWLLLLCTLGSVFALSYSPDLEIKNFWPGICGVFMCAFGWGIEGVILAKCLNKEKVESEYALQIRQSVSALVYGIVIVPAIGGWGFTIRLFSAQNLSALLIIAAAAFCATASYLCYYKAIAKIGASKAMALNITYTAWAMIFGVIIFRNYSILTVRTIACFLVVVVCGILTAVDIKELLRTRR